MARHPASSPSNPGLQAAAKEIADVEARSVRFPPEEGTGGIVWRVWGDGPPLVLLHGDFGSWTHWIRNVLPLSRHFRVIVPDMPGYGDSASPATDWTPESLAATLSDALREIEAGPYALAGFSFGGIIAGHLAAADAERVRTLVLVGAGGFALPFPPLPPLKRMSDGMDENERMSVHRHNLVALMIAEPAGADDLAVLVQGENVRRARIRAGDIPLSDSLLRALERVRAPICGLWGERDALSGRYIGDRERLLRDFQADVDFRTVPGAGHWVPFEASGAVNEALVEMAGR